MAQHILVIEDDPLSARLADLVLKSVGYEVTIAQNGLQGLKIARETQPDLILLDLMLPGLDGFEVLNRLRSDSATEKLRVVIVSSKSQPADQETAAKIGADAYITKPYRKANLLAVVNSFLSEREGGASASDGETRGVGVLFVGAQGDESTAVMLYTGLALASDGASVTAVDLRPFSVAHAVHLGVTPRSDPAVLSDPQTLDRLAELTVQHATGLRLLNNVEGGDSAGQLTPDDAQSVIDALKGRADFVLVDLPLYPADLLQRVAGQCKQVVLVTGSDAASVAAARSALTVMERSSVGLGRAGVVFVDTPPGQEADLGLDVIGVIQEALSPQLSAFERLAERLRRLEPSSDEE